MKRLDIYLVENNYFSSREKAKNAINQGIVLVEGQIQNKPSFLVSEGMTIQVLPHEQFVSRGAFKIKRAFDIFNFTFCDKVVLDIGASTGGFTQFALSKGATKVYAVDVGSGELDATLKQDKRVVNLENTDFRNLTLDCCKDTQLIIGDVSFISLRHIFPNIVELFGNKIEVVMLFKPQFECGIAVAKKFKGVVLDKKIHINLINDFLVYLKVYGFEISNFTYSDVKGKEGNIEYLIHLNGKENSYFKVEDVVSQAFQK